MLGCMRRKLAWSVVATGAILHVASCSGRPSYTLLGSEGGQTLADGGGLASDANEVGDATTLADGAKCFTKKNGDHFRFFMTAQQWKGDLLARPAGERPDDLCRAAGSSVWPGTHWKAYYWAVANQHPSKQLGEPCDGWWVSPKNKGAFKVFPNIASLLGAPLGDINVTELGEPYTTGATRVWTGGTALNAGKRCGSWDSQTEDGVTGWPFPDLSSWMSTGTVTPCSADGHLYCIELP